METNTIPELFTRKEAAEKLKVSLQFLDDQCKLKNLTHVRFGRWVYFREIDLNNFIENMAVKAQ